MRPRALIEQPLPGGGAVKLRELTGSEELLCAADVKLTDGQPSAVDNLRSNWAQIARSLVAIAEQREKPPKDAPSGTQGDWIWKPYDRAGNTPETTRDLFSARDFRVVQLAFMRLHAIDNDEEETFRTAARLTVEEDLG